MRFFALLAIPALLAACATPREQCLADVSRDLRINEALITQTQANIERGYALRREQRVQEITRTCRGRTATGEEVRTRCPDVIVQTVNVPEAIDLSAERAKLASLRSRNAALRRTVPAAQQECLLLNPA